MGPPKAPKLVLCRLFSDTYSHLLTLTHNDEISHVKHVLAPLYVFFTLFGYGGGGSQGV